MVVHMDELLIGEIEVKLRQMILEIHQPTILRLEKLTDRNNDLQKDLSEAQKAIDSLEVQVQKAHLIDTFREDLLKAEETRVKHEFRIEADLESVRSDLETFRYSLDRKQQAIERQTQECHKIVQDFNRLETYQKNGERKILEKLESALSNLWINVGEMQRAHQRLESNVGGYVKDIWSEDRGIGSLKREVHRSDRMISELMEGMDSLTLLKVQVEGIVRSQEDATQRIERQIEASKLLDQKVANLMASVDEKFLVSTNQIAAHTASFIKEVRNSYRDELAKNYGLRSECSVVLDRVRDFAGVASKAKEDVFEKIDVLEQLAFQIKAMYDDPRMEVNFPRNRSKTSTYSPGCPGGGGGLGGSHTPTRTGSHQPPTQGVQAGLPTPSSGDAGKAPPTPTTGTGAPITPGALTPGSFNNVGMVPTNTSFLTTTPTAGNATRPNNIGGPLSVSPKYTGDGNTRGTNTGGSAADLKVSDARGLQVSGTVKQPPLDLGTVTSNETLEQAPPPLKPTHSPTNWTVQLLSKGWEPQQRAVKTASNQAFGAGQQQSEQTQQNSQASPHVPQESPQNPLSSQPLPALTVPNSVLHAATSPPRQMHWPRINQTDPPFGVPASGMAFPQPYGHPIVNVGDGRESNFKSQFNAKNFPHHFGNYPHQPSLTHNFQYLSGWLAHVEDRMATLESRMGSMFVIGDCILEVLGLTLAYDVQTMRDTGVYFEPDPSQFHPDFDPYFMSDGFTSNFVSGNMNESIVNPMGRGSAVSDGDETAGLGRSGAQSPTGKGRITVHTPGPDLGQNYPGVASQSFAGSGAGPSLHANGGASQEIMGGAGQSIMRSGNGQSFANLNHALYAQMMQQSTQPAPQKNAGVFFRAASQAVQFTAAAKAMFNMQNMQKIQQQGSPIGLASQQMGSYVSSGDQRMGSYALNNMAFQSASRWKPSIVESQGCGSQFNYFMSAGTQNYSRAGGRTSGLLSAKKSGRTHQSERKTAGEGMVVGKSSALTKSNAITSGRASSSSKKKSTMERKNTTALEESSKSPPFKNRASSKMLENKGLMQSDDERSAGKQLEGSKKTADNRSMVQPGRTRETVVDAEAGGVPDRDSVNDNAPGAEAVSKILSTALGKSRASGGSVTLGSMGLGGGSENLEGRNASLVNAGSAAVSAFDFSKDLGGAPYNPRESMAPDDEVAEMWGASQSSADYGLSKQLGGNLGDGPSSTRRLDNSKTSPDQSTTENKISSLGKSPARKTIAPHTSPSPNTKRRQSALVTTDAPSLGGPKAKRKLWESPASARKSAGKASVAMGCVQRKRKQSIMSPSSPGLTSQGSSASIASSPLSGASKGRRMSKMGGVTSRLKKAANSAADRPKKVTKVLSAVPDDQPPSGGDLGGMEPIGYDGDRGNGEDGVTVRGDRIVSGSSDDSDGVGAGFDLMAMIRDQSMSREQFEQFKAEKENKVIEEGDQDFENEVLDCSKTGSKEGSKVGSEQVSKEPSFEKDYKDSNVIASRQNLTASGQTTPVEKSRSNEPALADRINQDRAPAVYQPGSATDSGNLIVSLDGTIQQGSIDRNTSRGGAAGSEKGNPLSIDLAAVASVTPPVSTPLGATPMSPSPAGSVQGSPREGTPAQHLQNLMCAEQSPKSGDQPRTVEALRLMDQSRPETEGGQPRQQGGEQRHQQRVLIAISGGIAPSHLLPETTFPEAGYGEGHYEGIYHGPPGSRGGPGGYPGGYHGPDGPPIVPVIPEVTRVVRTILYKDKALTVDALFQEQRTLIDKASKEMHVATNMPNVAKRRKVSPPKMMVKKKNEMNRPGRDVVPRIH